jgi:hypothetical protein
VLSVKKDTGCTISGLLDSCVKTGICAQSLYDDGPAHVFSGPRAAAYADAKKRRVTAYSSLLNGAYIASTNTYDITPMKACLTEGKAFAIALPVYENLALDTSRTLVIPPQNLWRTAALATYHCFTCVGYDDGKQAFLLSNSWGEGFGDDGYCWVSYAMVEQQPLNGGAFVADGITG